MSDVAATPRGSMPAMRRLRIFEKHGGKCVLCGSRIKAGDTWTIEHLLALGLGGSDTDDNCGPAHEACRRIKDKADVTSIAKAKRIKAKHYGMVKRRSSFPCGKDSKWRKRIDGTVERRT